MIRNFLRSTFFLISITTFAQQYTYSPYSLHGIGLTKFRGTVNYVSMGGLTVVSDPVTANILNAASYADLKVTNFAAGASYSLGEVQSASASAQVSAVSFDYLSFAFPAGKLGFGVGLLPYTASGYDIANETSQGTQLQSGEGGVNRAYFGIGAKVYKGLKVGAELRYNFGRLENEVIEQEVNTRVTNQSDISGVSYALSAIHDFYLKNDHIFRYALNYEGSGVIRSRNNQVISQIATLSRDGSVVPVGASQRGDVTNRKFDLASVFTVGLSYAKPNKWSFGGEVSTGNVNDFQDRFITRDQVNYINPFGLRFGGHYQPNYQSLSNYLARMIYRAGMRYNNTGLQFNGEDINEFGISFGISFPMSNGFSTIDLGFEAGSRGTTSAGAVKEDFLNFSVGLSLTDKWFNKRKYD